MLDFNSLLKMIWKGFSGYKIDNFFGFLCHGADLLSRLRDMESPNSFLEIPYKVAVCCIKVRRLALRGGSAVRRRRSSTNTILRFMTHQPDGEIGRCRVPIGTPR